MMLPPAMIILLRGLFTTYQAKKIEIIAIMIY